MSSVAFLAGLMGAMGASAPAVVATQETVVDRWLVVGAETELGANPLTASGGGEA